MPGAIAHVPCCGSRSGVLAYLLLGADAAQVGQILAAIVIPDGEHFGLRVPAPGAHVAADTFERLGEAAVGHVGRQQLTKLASDLLDAVDSGVALGPALIEVQAAGDDDVEDEGLEIAMFTLNEGEIEFTFRGLPTS